MESDGYIYGRNAVLEYLEHKPGHIIKLYLRQQQQGRVIQDLERLASQNRIPVQRVPGRKLAELVGPVNDQGIVAAVSEASYVELEDWLETVDVTRNPVIVALDEIEDPHNFGAIIRTALACGVDAVLVPKHRQAPMSGAVMKASAGAILHMPVIRVVNMNQSLLRLKEAGFWVCGTDIQAKQDFRNQDYNLPIVVIIGSEEKGIRKKTRDHCDMVVHIPMKNKVASLNASVSGALICYEILRQRQTEPE